MKKSRAQDNKSIPKKNAKSLDYPTKSKIALKKHIFRRLCLKHNSNQKAIVNKTLDTLIFNKNTHIAVAFKDEILFEYGDEFLKRYIF